MTSPDGCRWCSADKRNYMQRWAQPVGWHKWASPTLKQRKERVLARRDAR